MRLQVSICRLGLAAMLAGISVGCDALRKQPPPPADDFYELKQDKAGRIIRLNKVTGEVVIVEGNRLIPVKQLPPSAVGSPPSSSSAAPTTRAGAATKAPAKTAAEEPVAGKSASPIVTGEQMPTVREPALAPRVSESPAPVEPVVSEPPVQRSKESPYFRPGETVTIISAAPIFVTPRDNQTPLTQVNPGTALRIVSIEDEWYRVGFPDSQYGERIGFVSKKYARRTAMEPIDLSLPDLKEGMAKPADPSIKNPR
jgi:hypothetical protein